MLHAPRNAVRIVTASSLFDGHDASINIMRRILQNQGCEVIHLGHNRSVDEVVGAAVDEDVQGVAASSYQGGHVEYFEYLVSLLRERRAEHIKIFGGGGGVIVPSEVDRLRRSDVRIFSPEDGQRLGLPGMVNQIVEACDFNPCEVIAPSAERVVSGDRSALARAITAAQSGRLPTDVLDDLRAASTGPVILGITGTGGSGKSSLTDELLRRFLMDRGEGLRIAVLAIDPSRRRGGGALLGDRIRMNTLDDPSIYFRSLATRGAHEVPDTLEEVLAVVKAASFDLVVVETPGIGQGDAGVLEFVDTSIYVMTPEFGAASQLEKIDMLDHADIVAINKFERRGGMDALRHVTRQLVRNREAFGAGASGMPVFGTSAATFDDDGVTALYQRLRATLQGQGLASSGSRLDPVETNYSTRIQSVVPAERTRYLAEVGAAVRTYHRETERLARTARRHQALQALAEELLDPSNDLVAGDVPALLARTRAEMPDHLMDEIAGWQARVEHYVSMPGRESLAGTQVPRVALPRFTDHGELVRFWRRENLPGFFPFTAGVFPFRREDEDPARMFAGEGDPARTNRRFKLLSAGQSATRLSTAFDSVTLYGRDPDERPDVYGKIGTSGVSVATLEDMKELYEGFDLLAPTTSVSMTINGPAPTILAFFLNAVIDQAHERGATPDEALKAVRGTVQADILKEDQGQNTCLFSTEFSLRCMADVQEWFIERGVRNFYSVSISGYHIAEAGANPISQLAFTLANGFTYVEAYLARGMDIDDFAPNLSFFFSNGMDPEYSVIGRVARRIWAIAMRDRYGANERSQKLKYHVQTSGRSLHAQEMDFNDIRTTLQALIAIYDNANSLHTNAYDEAVTTPSEDSVRRALAIQLIINREWGLAMNENPLQGSFIIEQLTDLVEEAVLAEFDRITERGGVLGAMETGYQRGRIQDESMLYEHKKHDGTLPIIGVNTFRRPEDEAAPTVSLPLARATETEKRAQLDKTRTFRATHEEEARVALDNLKRVARSEENLFAALMDAARVCTLGQITEAFFEVGGQYRRNV
ncbi:fused isobutyryl-CoA mutase/GTPase IcmF [Nocardioides sp.]|uniref:fused isobutyryl-CoA mutase/GTPase IcmF n=1 Tax=Nocardioides sp. TaxID=35761 RepID=UPI003782E0B7